MSKNTQNTERNVEKQEKYRSKCLRTSKIPTKLSANIKNRKKSQNIVKKL